MKTLPKLVLASTTAVLAGCVSLGEAPDRKLATATLFQANGAPAGTALVSAAGDRVTISVKVIALSPGVHGMHLHSVGKCETSTFTSAGPHLNPHGVQHGSANPAGSHLGDLPNITADGLGTGTVTAVLDGNRSQIEAALFDSDGTAIVIHAAPDDYRTDPSGNSGARIACGVLAR